METKLSEHNRRFYDACKPEEREQVEEAFQACPHYNMHELTDDQIELIAEKAAGRAIELARKSFYQDVGKSVVGAALYMIGAIVVGLFAWIKLGK